MAKTETIYTSAMSAAITIIVVALITILADTNLAFKTWLASWTGHHWVTKSFITAILYPLFFVLLRTRKPRVNDARTATLTLNLVAIAGFVLILAFYFFEYLK